MPTAQFPTVSLVFPDGAHVVLAMPGIPRTGDTVSARWGKNPSPTLYTVTGVVWDLNELRVLVHILAAARA
jgi:hypothetical protein